jgi:hypothetical protein
VNEPGWDDARGYSFDEDSLTLYFSVAKKYLPTDPNVFQVLVNSQPRVLVTGELRPAMSEDDVGIQLALEEAKGMAPDKARFIVLDQRSNKARRIRYKLLITRMEKVEGLLRGVAGPAASVRRRGDSQSDG